MDKIDIAVQRIKEAARMSEYFYKKPLLLTDSGGKDSSCVVELARIAGVNFELSHSHTSADAPETVRFLRNKFRDFELNGTKCTIEMPRYKGEPVSMWSLIPIKKMPPTRLMRYCCSVLKETAGKNRCITTGVRWSESAKRGNRGVYETIASNVKNRVILNNDNDDKRKLFERCELQAKTVCNPIIDWTDNDVWDFLKYTKCKVNPLYTCGFARVGCIGCPMAGKKRYKEFELYPKYKSMYIHAFDRMIAARINEGRKTEWENGEDVFRWWMEEDWRQTTIFDFLEGEEE